MNLHHPLYLEDCYGRFLLLNGSVEIHDGSYYYTGIWDNKPILHVHKTGDSHGTTTVLDKTVEVFEAVHALQNMVIEAMSGDYSSSIHYHRAYCGLFRLDILISRFGSNDALATIKKFVHTYKTTSKIGLPINRTGLEIATNLLRIIK